MRKETVTTASAKNTRFRNSIGADILLAVFRHAIVHSRCIIDCSMKFVSQIRSLFKDIFLLYLLLGIKGHNVLFIILFSGIRASH